jgi:hypothetical protein
MVDTKPHDAHRQYKEAYNSGKIDSLLALYTPDARLVTESGDGRGCPAATGRALALSHRQSAWFRVGYDGGMNETDFS